MDMVSYDVMLQQLESELASIESEYAKLNRKRTLLQEAITKVKDLKALAVQTVHQTARNPLKPYKGMKTIPAAVKYLRGVGEPQTNRVLTDALIAGGLPTKATKPYMSIRSILTRAMEDKSTFTWEDGKWGLPEWKARTHQESQSILDVFNENPVAKSA
jgi:hypothetical protein